MSDSAGTAIVIGMTSDIGTALARRWAARGWEIFGTYRTPSPASAAFIESGIELVHCDLSDCESVRGACSELRDCCPEWDVLILCVGILEPVGPFQQCDFDEWKTSFGVNCTGPLRVVHELLPHRRKESQPEPITIFFAGGGTNDAPPNYSAYILAKIALIKMTELLDAEIPDTRFVIVGPGWVHTKIHESTLKAGVEAGDNYQRLLDRMERDDWVPMDRVMDCLDWVIGAPREAIGGRNFSVEYDEWGSPSLERALIMDENLYKLRRKGNK